MEGSAFPFAEGNAGSVLPVDFLVDALILLPQGAVLPVHLSSLTIGAALIGGTLKDGNDVVIASFQVSISQMAGGRAELTDPDSGTARGLLIFGPSATSVFGKIGLGVTSFKADQSTFEPGCLLPLPKHSVAAIRIVDRILVGKVALAEGDGINIVKIDDNSFRVDAVGSTSKRDGCCQDLGTPLKKVNDATPDVYGNVQFALEPFNEPASPQDIRQILRIRPITNGVEFSLAK